MAFKIGVLTEKGGGGKTMISINLAGWLRLSYPDKTVGVLDTCYAKHSTDWLATRVHNAYPDLFDVEQENNEVLVGRSINRMAARFDFVVVDGHPKLDGMLKNTAVACDLIVIPVRPDKPDAQSAIRTAGYILGCTSNTPIAFLLTDWDSTNNAKDIYNELVEANADVRLPIIGMPRHLFQSRDDSPNSIVIGRTAWKESMKVGKTVFEEETPAGPAVAEANNAFIKLMELSQ